MKTVALIIAKKNSKRLLRKNFLDFCGRPMFEWNIIKAQKLFKEVYFSSDSLFMLKEAKKLGAIAIKRPKKLALDNVPSVPVFQHALQFMHRPDIIVSIQPNSPTVKPKIIKTAKELMENYHFREFMTVHRNFKIYGSVWAMTRKRLKNYGNSYHHKPECMLVDDSIDIHNKADFLKAQKIMKKSLS